MGTWGPGNFDGDSPRDYLGSILLQFEQYVERLLAGEPPDSFRLEDGEGCLIPTLVIMTTLAEALPCDHLPRPEAVARWKEEYLRQYDAQIDGFDPAPGFKEERRRVIAATFDRLMERVRKHWEEVGG